MQTLTGPLSSGLRAGVHVLLTPSRAPWARPAVHLAKQSHLPCGHMTWPLFDKAALCIVPGAPSLSLVVCVCTRGRFPALFGLSACLGNPPFVSLLLLLIFFYLRLNSSTRFGPSCFLLQPFSSFPCISLANQKDQKERVLEGGEQEGFSEVTAVTTKSVGVGGAAGSVLACSVQLLRLPG